MEREWKVQVPSLKHLGVFQGASLVYGDGFLSTGDWGSPAHASSCLRLSPQLGGQVFSFQVALCLSVLPCLVSETYYASAVPLLHSGAHSRCDYWTFLLGSLENFGAKIFF